MTTPVRPAPAVALPQDTAPEDSHPVILTTPEEVERWLRRLAPEEICGRPHMPNECPLARYLNARNGEPARGTSVASDSYSLADARYPLPAWAQHFVVRVDHSPARWKRPAAQGISASQALRLLDGLDEGRGDWRGDESVRQEGQDGCAGHAAGDGASPRGLRHHGGHGPHTGDGPVDGGTIGAPDGTALRCLSWPRLTLPVSTTPPRAGQTGPASL
jgi:hypothetical protein